MEREHAEIEVKIKNGETSPLLSKVGSSEYLSDTKPDSRPKTFDEAIDLTGVGLFHCILVLVAGWALASDSVEVQCISFVTPLLDNPGANPDTQLAPSKVWRNNIHTSLIFI